MEGHKIKPFFQNLWKKYGYNIFLYIGALGLILIMLPLPDKSRHVDKSEDYTEQFKNSLEDNLIEIISSINGAGKVKVMVTLESGQEIVYAWQEKTTDDSQTLSANANINNNKRSSYENQVVIVADGGEKHALIEKTLQPAVQGVIVVCQGADDINVVSDITNAVSVVLNITTNRICVIKME